MNYGIADEQLQYAIEQAMYAFREKLAEELTALEMVDDGVSFDNYEGLVIYDGEGQRIKLGEHGEIDIEVNVGRFQTKHELDEEAAMYEADDALEMELENGTV